MAKCLIIRGNSGSGKTSVAQAVQKHYGASCLLLSQDVVRRGMLSEFGQSGTLTVSLIAEMARFGYRENLLVILEGFFETDPYGQMLNDLQELFADKVLAYYYDLTFEETVKRHQTRDKRHDFTPEDMKRWWRDKDLLGWSDEIILHDEAGFEEVVQDMIERLDKMT